MKVSKQYNNFNQSLKYNRSPKNPAQQTTRCESRTNKIEKLAIRCVEILFSLGMTLGCVIAFVFLIDFNDIPIPKNIEWAITGLIFFFVFPLILKITRKPCPEAAMIYHQRRRQTDGFEPNLNPHDPASTNYSPSQAEIDFMNYHYDPDRYR